MNLFEQAVKYVATATRHSRTFLKTLIITIAVSVSTATAPEAIAGSYTDVNRQPGALCQLGASLVINEARKALSNIKIGQQLLDLVNPFTRFNPAKSAKKLVAVKKSKAIIAVAILAAAAKCPPIVVPAPFIGQSRSFRINRALEAGLDPKDPDLILDVADPGNPNSCTRTLTQQLDISSGKIIQAGDFPSMEFVYAEPFGSYPTAQNLLSDKLKELVQRLMSQIRAMLPPDLLPDMSFDDPLAFIDDATKIPDVLNPSLGEVIPHFDELLDAMLGLSVLNYEEQMNASFHGWLSTIIDLPTSRVRRTEVGADTYEFEFSDGLTQFDVVADNPAASLPGQVYFNYTQRIFVNENFKPDFDVLYEIEDPNNPGVMLRIVADGEYEALEPGRADRSYTPPTSFEGSLGAFDNCDPDPQEFLHIPTELTLGIHYFPITAIDRAGNESDVYHVRINVVDTIPPDVNPPESIGIEVAQGTTTVQFTDAGIGCTTFLCQNSLPDRQVFPPAYFDFATITPSYDCFASNTLGNDQPCDQASLPVGEATAVRWEATDPSGNIDTIVQHVAIREAGANLAPVASGTSVTVASGVSTTIPLQASDPEFDPLGWQVNSLPVNGQLEVTPDPQFQTRFSFSGTMEKMSSIVKLDGMGGGSFVWDRVLLADEGNHRLIEMDSYIGTGASEIHFTHFLGNVKPSSILLFGNDNAFKSVQNETYLDDLLVADWSTGKIHTLHGPGHSPDAGYDLSQWLTNPAHIAMQMDGADALLFITEPDPADPSGGKILVLRVVNFNPASNAESWAISLETTIGLNAELAGFNPAGITATDCGSLLLSDSDPIGAGVNARMASYFYIASNDHFTDRVWDISSLTINPPGDARPVLGQQIELVGKLNTNCSNYEVFVADNDSKEIIPLRLNGNGSIVADTAIRAGTEFITIYNLQAPAANKFYVMDENRLVGYDINGVIDSLIFTRVSPDNGHNFDALTPGDSGSLMIDMDLAGNGDLFMLDYGRPDNNSAVPGVLRVQIQPGFSQFTRLTNERFSKTLNAAWALAYSPGATAATGDDRVFMLGNKGIEYFNANDLNPLNNFDELVLSGTFGVTCLWCNAAGFDPAMMGNALDVEADGNGNIYVSDDLDRVHKFTAAGLYEGWLGRCDGGTGCDVANGHSFGFSCTSNSCTAGQVSGSAQGQFDFQSTNKIRSKRPRYGRLMIDEQSGLIYVSDFIDNDNDITTPRLPRIQSFSLSSGAFNNETRPDGAPGNLLSFLNPGDFTDVNDMAVFEGSFYVAEDKPLERLHVFDATAFRAGLDGAVVNYISDPGFEGSDFFDYSVRDSFGADSNIAAVDITVVLDNEPPQLACPADIVIEGTHPGGAQPSNFIQAQAGSVVLADFLEAYVLSDNVTAPPAVASHDAPALFPLGDTLVTFTAIDGAGNQASCAAMVTVIDTVAPQVASVVDLQIEASAVLTPYTPPQPAVSDLVGPLSVSVSPAGPYPLGVTDLVWIATDGAGNSTRVKQRLTVVDTVAPMFGLQPPYPDQEAINGYGNPLGYVVPGVLEAVELADSVHCLPVVNAMVASLNVTVWCQTADSTGNYADMQFDINVVQSDGDFDGISNIVDPAPAAADGSGLFSDIPLGGNTFGQVIAVGSFDVRVSDAWLEEQGVRIEAHPLVIQQTQAAGGQGQQGAAKGEPVEIDACNGDLHISGLTDGVDADGFSGPGVAVIGCQPLLAIAEIGSFSLSLAGPQDSIAHIDLKNGNGISFDGTRYSAPESNTEPVIITSPQGILNVAPGQVVLGTRPIDIPAVNIWGMLGLLLLLGGVAAREIERRQRRERV